MTYRMTFPNFYDWEEIGLQFTLRACSVFEAEASVFYKGYSRELAETWKTKLNLVVNWPYSTKIQLDGQSTSHNYQFIDMTYDMLEYVQSKNICATDSCVCPSCLSRSRSALMNLTIVVDLKV